jgi:hypothetical protein
VPRKKVPQSFESESWDGKVINHSVLKASYPKAPNASTGTNAGKFDDDNSDVGEGIEGPTHLGRLVMHLEKKVYWIREEKARS